MVRDCAVLGYRRRQFRDRGGRQSAGAAGIGDPLFPTLGNGGYDVEHYRLDLRYPTAVPTEPFQGSVVIDARATQALSQFNLDWGGGPVGAVRVNGRRAAWEQAGEELVVRPSKPLADGRRFPGARAGLHDHAAGPR